VGCPVNDKTAKEEKERTCGSWQCSDDNAEIVELSDNHFLCTGCGSVEHEGTYTFGGSPDWELGNSVQSLAKDKHALHRFFDDLPTVLERMLIGMDSVHAVNQALVAEVQRLHKRIEKLEASHGIQQVPRDEKENPVDEGTKADPGGEDSSSS